MKRFIGIILLALCASANASVDYYDGNGVSFPDEVSPHGLPEAIPCVTKKAYTGQAMLVCTWLANARNIDVWDDKRQRDVQYNNQVGGQCRRGTCRIEGVNVGQWQQDVPFLVSRWYNIGSSVDGKPVAYRVDVSRKVTYAEAGALLWQFYLDAGIPDDQLVSTFDKRYEGGWSAWCSPRIGDDCFKDVQKTSVQSPAAQQSYPDVKSAWCNPRADDDCYINNKKVPIAELGKYLPAISESNADQLGGGCETILCFDKDDQPLGYMSQE
ncbi:hypothetical protein D3C72_951540 [compost metagenome]